MKALHLNSRPGVLERKDRLDDWKTFEEILEAELEDAHRPWRMFGNISLLPSKDITTKDQTLLMILDKYLTI